MDFVNQHKYQDNERAIYKYVLDHDFNTIVELGYGSGALTVAMSYGTNDNCKIYSYDLCSSDLAIQRLHERNLLHKCNFTVGDVNNTYIQKPFSFDLLLIDIHNTWSIVFDVTMNNEFINKQIKNGSKVIIEGGGPLHPRMNKNTLTEFHNSLGRKVFDFEHISGERTSLSILNLL